MEQRRCAWAGSDPLYLRYHDREWGVPQRRDRGLFEMLILEGGQAGLSWLIILRKRGMKFVGSTICHAFMQATGMVNDHTTGCFRYRELLGGS
jgi:3-methyladenine DNA glycosylase Tag